MDKQELEEKIAKGESVWQVQDNKVYNINAVKELLKNGWGDYWCNFTFNTKAEAEHYLRHANITRTETLPFLTWEEFRCGGKVNFIGKNGKEYLLKEKQSSVMIICLNNNMSTFSRFATEENFYKAYDECVKLFKGEQI